MASRSVIEVRKGPRRCGPPRPPQGGQGEVSRRNSPDGDSVGLSSSKLSAVSGIRVCEGVLADEPEDIVQGHQQVGDDQRIVRDVFAADIQQPGDLVQGGEEDGIGPLLYQPLAQPLDAGLPAFTGEVLPQRDDGRNGMAGRSVHRADSRSGTGTIRPTAPPPAAPVRRSRSGTGHLRR